MTIHNDGSRNFTWSRTYKTDSGGDWLFASPQSNSLKPGESEKLRVRVEAQNLAQGTYTATIDITATNSDNSPQRVSVQVTKAGNTDSVVLI